MARAGLAPLVPVLALLVSACARHVDHRPNSVARTHGPDPLLSDEGTDPKTQGPFVHAEFIHGAICRAPSDAKRLSLVFTGHEFAEGAESILNTLRSRHAKASFFLTGDFLANPAFETLVQRLVREGHYLGPHSDKHLLYCSWDATRRTLVTRDQFELDLRANLEKIRRFQPARPGFFLPPYEHYNQEIAAWTKSMNLVLVNYTQGTRSNADYTGEADRNFVSSQTIFESIIAREREDPRGLNGFLLLLHVGAGPGRRDKFYPRLGELMDYLHAKGYAFQRIDELLRVAPASVCNACGTFAHAEDDAGQARSLRVPWLQPPQMAWFGKFTAEAADGALTSGMESL